MNPFFARLRASTLVYCLVAAAAASLSLSGCFPLLVGGATGAAVVAMERLDFTVRRGEVVAIVGKTGCGKSTFFNVLIGLEEPSEGRIEIGGRTPYGDFDFFRGRIGIIFQQDRLLPWRTLIDNVTLGLEIIGMDPAAQRAEAERWLQRLGLEKFLRAFPNELSGGMRQRAAMARAREAEMQALVQENRAQVVEAEASIPLAIAEAFRSGHLGVMDYYRIRNIQADTTMRGAIGGQGQSDAKQ